jgi:mono/diheme cytochrome c family protein
VLALVACSVLISGIAGAQTGGDAKRGEALFGEKGCNGCHRVSGVGGEVGPDLTRLFKLDLPKDRPGQRHTNVVEYVRESIRDPQAYIVPKFPNPSPMPSAKVFELTERNIDDLIAYLRKAAGSAMTN